MEAAFCIKWPTQPAHTIVLEDGALETRIRYDDAHRRVYDAVNFVVGRLLDFKRRSDIRPDLWIVVLPEDVSRYGRPKSNLTKSERIATPTGSAGGKQNVSVTRRFFLRNWRARGFLTRMNATSIIS